MADKIVKAFEALRSHYLQESTQTVVLTEKSVLTEGTENVTGSHPKKGYAQLSVRDRINYCNIISDFLPMQTVKDFNEFPRFLTLAMELLLVSCDDEEADVRLVAGETINKIMKVFLDSNIGRIQVELYKEIKKNGSSRSLRVAMQRFGDTSHLIRNHKRRPYVANLLPCIVKIVKREDDSIQEILSTFMSRIAPVLGSFMTEGDVKILLKAFLPNLKSSSAVKRRTAASSLNTICQNSRKPLFFYNWLINMLLGMIIPLTDDLAVYTILGVLTCFRGIVPHLDIDQTKHGIKGIFSSKQSKFGSLHGKGETLEKKKYLQIYEVTMFCTRHKDHNVVTSALENLYQALQCQAEPLVEILLSPTGIASTITGQLTSYSDTERTDSPILDEGGGSGISSDTQSLSSISFTASDLCSNTSSFDIPIIADSGLGESVNGPSNNPIFSAIPHFPSASINDQYACYTNEEDDSNDDEKETEGLRLPRTYTNGSMVEIEGDPLSVQRERLESNFVDIQEETRSQNSIDELFRNESICSTDVRAVIERKFHIDAVACTGVPLLNCVRLLCSFLLSGEPGKILGDSSTRVSVKSLALHCIGASLKLFPEALLAQVLPKELQLEGSSNQLVRDILLLRYHEDPQIRGSVSSILGHFIYAAMQTCLGEFKNWSVQISQRYNTEPLDMYDCISIIIGMFKDESAITIKQNCLATKNCIFGLLDSDYNLFAYELVRQLIHLHTCSYWLVKIEILDVFHQLDYKLLLILEPYWFEMKDLCNLNKKFVNIQVQTLDVLIQLLGDEDVRVREAASSSITKVIPKLYISNVVNKETLLYSALTSSEPKIQTDRINSNLSAVVRKIFNLQYTTCSKFMMHGCTHCLYMLSEAFPPLTYIQEWEVLPTPVNVLNNQNQNLRRRAPLKTSPVFSINPARRLNFGGEDDVTNTCGILNVTLDFVSAGWMMLDLQAHQDALKLCIHVLCGACSHKLKKMPERVDKFTSSLNTVDVAIKDPWSFIGDKQLICFAKRIFAHITRVLHVLMHVIDETNPLAGVKLITGLTKDKDKATPGNVTNTSPNIVGAPSSNTTAQSVSPRKFNLSKAIQRKQEPEMVKSVENEGHTPTSDIRTTPNTPVTPQSADRNERLGSFQNIPQFLKLYEILKGAYKNYQSSSIFQALEKFNGFVRAILESFSLFLELATFNELGSHVEEFLDYLKATVRVEEEKTFLAVQQLLKGLFGTNAANDPEVYKLPASIKQLLMTHGDSSKISDFTNGSEKLIGQSTPSNTLYEHCFSFPLSKVSESLSCVPVADSAMGSLERGSKAITLFQSFKKSFSNASRPIAKVSKERVASIQSYIRLFEPLVIHALKSYTTTSSVTLQCQAIHLLDQLIRLRVNYSLLDSDQVFIGFILKQFEFITNGQIQSPEMFIPTVFQFLVLLSYECYQPKFTQAKAIIGMPRIMRLCDEIMACEQPALTHAIPSLKPIVCDLFNPQSHTRPDSAKDLDIQREVVVSMLLRVVQYPEVLHMLTLVLKGIKSDSEKWKRLSRLIIDALLPSLSKLNVQTYSTEHLQTLFTLMDAVAPLALRPGDIILKPLLDIQIPTRKQIPHALCTIITLLRTLVMQNKEDMILARIQQLDTSFIRPCFIFIIDKHGEQSSVRNEQEAAVYFSHFILYFVNIASEDIKINFNLLTTDRMHTLATIPLLETILVILSYIGKSGSFKVLSSTLLALLTQQTSHDSISLCDSISENLRTIKTQESLCFLKWLHCLQSIGLSDEMFWRRQFETLEDERVQNFQVAWKKILVNKGALLIYCNFLLSLLKKQKKESGELIINILNNFITTLMLHFNEPPVKELVSRILQNPELTEVFLKSVTRNFSPDLFQEKFAALNWLLHHVECVDLLHSSAVIQLLLKILPHLKIYGLARKAETLTCRRVDYIQSLSKKEGCALEELATFAKSIGMKRSYPRLCSSIDRINKKNDTNGVSFTNHPLQLPDLDVNGFVISKAWMVKFVEKLCIKAHEDELEKKSTVRLLRSLNLEDISAIMQNQNFDKGLLETCIDEAYFTEEVQMQNPRTGTNSARLDLHESFSIGGSTERENKDILLLYVKQIVFNNIRSILPAVIYRHTYRNHSYFAFKTSSSISFVTDNEKKTLYTTLIKCIIKFISPSCYHNKLWSLNEEMGLDVTKFILLFPILCSEVIKTKQDIFLSLELCFNVTALLLHCQELSIYLANQSCAFILTQSIDSIYMLVKDLALSNGKEIANIAKWVKKNENDSQGHSIFHVSCEQVSDLVDALQNIASIHNTREDRIPKFLLCSLRQTITGLARLSFVNSYVRIPPVVWSFGWSPAMEGDFGTELPPLPVDILKEKDVLKEFVNRVNRIGWTSRMQYEETWAALLGVLSAPPVVEDSSTEEEIELAEASCLAVHCITSLILETMLAPVPGNSAISKYSVIHRSRDFPFMGTKGGKKLLAIRSEIEMEFNKQIVCSCSQINSLFHPIVPSLLSSKQRKQHLINGYMMESKLYVSNLELPCDLESFNLGQISASAIRTRLVSSDVQEDTDSDDSDSLIIQVKEKTPNSNLSIESTATTYRKVEELDIRSCLQFLLELYEQWLSLYAVPKTPLMLRMEAIKSLCVLSDFLLELNHYEWVLGILLDYSQNHAVEDDILTQYLVPTICKALAILKMEGLMAERIIKQIEISIKSPHLPLQVSCLVGSLYILESFVSSTNVLLVPLLTENITKKLPTAPEGTSCTDSKKYTVMLWTVAFYLLENFSSEIQDPHFAATIFEVAINELCKVPSECCPGLLNVIFRGLERLAISFSLTRADCERLAKISVTSISMASHDNFISALGLLCTCMYTGKDAEKASGLSTVETTLDVPITDSRLIVMERITVLLSRIRKGHLEEANLLATILPRILLDFLSVQEVMNKLISEFLSSQQPRPEIIAKIFNKVAELLYKEGEEVVVRDWVFLCIGSFVQRTPLSMAVWSLTCFFISSSSNPWLKSVFPYIVERKGKMEDADLLLFKASGLDFYNNQNLDAAQQKQFIQTFRSKADPLSPYESLLSICLSFDYSTKNDHKLK